MFIYMNLLADATNISAWQTFYEIVGSSGGALVGLQFVVIALIANTRTAADSQSIDAFGTPNTLHFGAALTISAIMSAPWPSLLYTSVAMALCGVMGLVYSASVFHRARRQTVYKPVPEDWLWYAIVPCGIYGVLTVVALLLRLIGQFGLFMVAGSALGLLLVGIRNAWDSVTHIVVRGNAEDAKKSH